MPFAYCTVENLEILCRVSNRSISPAFAGVPGSAGVPPARAAATWAVRLHIFALVWLLVLQLYAPCAAWANEEAASAPAGADAAQAQVLQDTMAEAEDKIRHIDRQILLEFVELDRFNIRYRLEANRAAPWRSFVYPMAQEANAALLTANVIVGISQNARGWNKPRLVSKTALKKGFVCGALGSIIGGASSAVELAADTAQVLRERRLGFSSERAVACEQAKVKHINELLALRDKLVNDSTLTGDRRELVELKGNMGRYIRDRLVWEFKLWNGRARAYSWYKNSFYVLNILSNFTRFASIELGIKGLKYPRDNGGAGPTGISAGFIAATSPAISYGIGMCMKQYLLRHLDKKLGSAQVQSDEEMEQQYQRAAQLLSAAAAHDETIKKLMADIATLRKDTIGLDEVIRRETRKTKEIRRVAAQQAIVGPIVGTLSLASGTLGTIGYYGYRFQPKINNRLGLPNGLLSLGGGALALYQTPKGMIQGRLYEHNLRQKGEHPDQLLGKRLVDLDEIESTVKHLSLPAESH
jgi:hypothetical protein